MTDVKRALTEMAERGEPLGSELLRQRVTGELVIALPRTHRRRPALALAGAALATLLVVGLGGVALLFVDEEPPIGDQPIPTEIPVTPERPADPPPTLTSPIDPALDGAPTPTPTPSPAPVPSPVIWTEVTVSDDNPVFYGGFLNAVTVGEPGLVAVGGVYTGVDTWLGEGDVLIEGPGGETAAAVWVSENGVDWSRIGPAPGVFDGPRDQEILDVAVAGSRVVAVGRETWDPDPLIDWDSHQSDAAVWISSDSRTWQRVPDPENMLGGPDSQLMRAVIRGGPGFIAVGSDGDAPAVWLSADGSAWDRASVDDLPSGDAGTIHGVVAFGSGFVAVGAVAAGGPLDDFHFDLDPAAAVWTSRDGSEWSRVPHVASVFDEAVSEAGIEFDRGDYEMYSVSRAGEHLVAVGQTGVGESQRAIWVSRDGVVWQRLMQGEADWGLGRRNMPLHSIVADGDRFTAVGVILWNQQFDDHVGREMNDAVVFEGDIIAVGSVDGGTTGAVWSGTFEE